MPTHNNVLSPTSISTSSAEWGTNTDISPRQLNKLLKQIEMRHNAEKMALENELIRMKNSQQIYDAKLKENALLFAAVRSHSNELRKDYEIAVRKLQKQIDNLQSKGSNQSTPSIRTIMQLDVAVRLTQSILRECTDSELLRNSPPQLVQRLCDAIGHFNEVVDVVNVLASSSDDIFAELGERSKIERVYLRWERVAPTCRTTSPHTRTPNHNTWTSNDQPLTPQIFDQTPVQNSNLIEPPYSPQVTTPTRSNDYQSTLAYDSNPSFPYPAVSKSEPVASYLDPEVAAYFKNTKAVNYLKRGDGQNRQRKQSPMRSGSSGFVAPLDDYRDGRLSQDESENMNISRKRTPASKRSNSQLSQISQARSSSPSSTVPDNFDRSKERNPNTISVVNPPPAAKPITPNRSNAPTISFSPATPNKTISAKSSTSSDSSDSDDEAPPPQPPSRPPIPLPVMPAPVAPSVTIPLPTTSTTSAHHSTDKNSTRSALERARAAHSALLAKLEELDKD